MAHGTTGKQLIWIKHPRKQKPTSEAALEEYHKASPAHLLPVTFPLLIVYGTADTDVPPDLVPRSVFFLTESVMGAEEDTEVK